MSEQHTITDTRFFTGIATPDLTTWLGPAPHSWDSGQLVLHTPDGDIHPRPGSTLVRWSDGTVTSASPRIAQRVYGPDGQLARYTRLLRVLTTAEDAPTHCHIDPPTWDGGGPCEYCTALLEARAELAALDAPGLAATEATEPETTAHPKES